MTPEMVPRIPPPSRLRIVTSDPHDGGLFLLQDESFAMIVDRSLLSWKIYKSEISPLML